MARKLYRFIMSSCLGLGVTSCHSGMAPPFVGPGVALEECVGTTDFKTVVRVMIPKTILRFQPSSRFVRHSNRDSNSNTVDEEDEYNSSAVNDSPDPMYENNPVHIDLRQVAANYPKDKSPYFKVKIFIENKDMEFWTDPTSGAVGIERPTPSPSKPDEYAGVLCRKAGDNPNTVKKRPVLAFFVKRGTKQAIPINLLVVGKQGGNGYDTPIIIDPKIQNDG